MHKIKRYGIQMKKLFVTGILTLCMGLSSYAQNKITTLNQGNIEQKTYKTVIKYRLINGKMLVPVTIQGKQYTFLFDTGAPLSISEKIFQIISPKVIGAIPISDGTGKVHKMKIISLPELILNGITFTDTTGILLHKKSARIFNCLGVDGTIGSNMLRNSVIQVDGQNQQIIITDKASTLGLKNVIFQKIKLTPGQSSPYVMVALENNEKHLADMVLIDSGSKDFYNMSTKMYNYYKSKGITMNIIAESKGSFLWGIHGSESANKHYVLNITGFQLYKSIFKNIAVSTVADNYSRIGYKIFEYGKATIDYKNKLFYFEPFKKTALHLLSKRPWQIAPTMKNGKLVVGIIWDKSLKKQINVGDEILGINSIDYQSLGFCELLLTNKTTATGNQLTIKLKDIKTGKIKIIKIRRL